MSGDSVWQIKQVDFVTSCATHKQMLHDGVPQVAFAGRSNVGKSSLLNLLVNRKSLALVSSTPGRTRLVNFFSINRGEVYFVDLPGYGFAKTSAEMRGAWRGLMEAYLRENRAIRACCTLFDIRRELTAEDKALIQWLFYYHVPIIVALTKADKLTRSRQLQAKARMEKTLAEYGPVAVICSSVPARAGRDELLNAIAGVALGTETNPHENGILD